MLKSVVYEQPGGPAHHLAIMRIEHAQLLGVEPVGSGRSCCLCAVFVA